LTPDFHAILFDLDGVILESMGRHAAAWQEVLAARGVRAPVSFILENEGSLGPEVLKRFLDEHPPSVPSGQSPPSWDEMMDQMHVMLKEQAELYLERHADQVRPYAGARRLLLSLQRAGTPLALVTSSRLAVVRGCLPPELLDLFGAVVTADDVSRHKPHPDPYLQGARALGVAAEQCLVVENAPAGIESALAAGAVCYALSTTLPPEKLARAHAVFPDLKALARELTARRLSA
jgi:HAD superfamily hydrolase (TIGR01509 family)